MALEATSGTFDHPASTGNFSVTGVGFQPKVVLFFSASLDAFGAESEMQFAIGAAQSSTKEWTTSNAAVDGASTTNTARLYETTHCYRLVTPATGASYQADHVSMDADGFTLNASSVTGSTEKVSYLALGGSDLSNVDVGVFTAPSASGNDSVTGIGFQPDCVLFATVGTGSTGGTGFAIHSLGAATSATDQWLTAHTAEDAVSTSNTDRYQRTDKCIAQILRGGVSWEADLVSLDADGWTLNYSASTDGDTVAYVALKGAQFNVLNFNETNTSGTNVSQAVTGVGFQPSALMLAGFGRIATTAVVSEYALSLGFATGAANESVIAVTDEDAVGTTNTNKSHQNTKLYEARAPSTFAIVSDAELTSLDSDGFTLNWLNTDGGQDQILGLAIGESDTGNNLSFAAQAQNATTSFSVGVENDLTAAAQAQNAVTSFSVQALIDLSLSAQAQAAQASFSLAENPTIDLVAQAQSASASFSLAKARDVALAAEAQPATASFSMLQERSVIFAAQAQASTSSFSLFRYNNICWDEKTGAGASISQKTASGVGISEKSAGGKSVDEHRQEQAPDWQKCH